MEQLTGLFTGATAIAILTYIAFQLRSVPVYIFNQIKKRIVYTVHIDETTYLLDYFEKWLAAHHERSFKNVSADVIDEKIKFKHHTDIFFLKYKGKRLLITKSREKFENAGSFSTAFYNTFRIEGWFSKAKMVELFDDVIAYNDSLVKDTQTIYSNDIYGNWQHFGEILGKHIDNIVLKDKHMVIDNITDFIKNEQWYLHRGLNYKRGYLFYGLPGNGKTVFSLAIARHFKKDIYFLNLNDLTKDSHAFTAFNRIGNNSILVLEDIDAIMGNRDGVAKVSFSALLNCMDGAFSKHGVITIMTTNHIDKIDDALIREGRIDMKIRIDNPEKDMVEQYLSIFYEVPVALQKYEPIYSMSKIQEICLQNKDNVDEAVNTLSALHIPATNGQSKVVRKSLTHGV